MISRKKKGTKEKENRMKEKRAQEDSNMKKKKVGKGFSKLGRRK